MKVAVAHSAGVVAHRLDLATDFIVVEFDEEGSELVRQSLNVEQFAHPLSLINALKDAGVDTLICGAINNFFMRFLEFNRIRVISWVDATVAEALNLLLEGRLREGYVTPRSMPQGEFFFTPQQRRHRGRGHGKGRGCK